MKFGKVTQIAAAALLASAGTVAYAQVGGSQAQQPGASQQGVQPGGQTAPGRGGAGGAVQQQPGAGGMEKQPGASGQMRQEQMQRGQQQRPEGKAERRAGEKQGTREDGRQQARERPEGEQRKGAGGAGLRPDLSEEQRGNIRQHLSAGPRVDDVDVSISVGTRLPPRVSVRPLPPTVIEIVPQYRGYAYVLIGSQIVIVDPDTHEIVAVLPA